MAISWGHSADAPIFDSEGVAVYHEPRQPGQVIVTFGHLDFPYGDGRYWGKAVLARTRWSAIGIVSKRNDWFPRDTLLPALDAIASILSGYAARITYGFSMGGYAAVKHSALLRATHVLALSPQWSINPDETGAFDLRLARFYEASRNAEMSIQQSDVAGRLTLLYDPYVRPDVEHASRILRLYARPNPIPVPRIGHETIDIMAASEVAAATFDALLAGDESGLRSLLSDRRRTNGRRLINVILALRERHPSWSARLVESRRSLLRSDLAHLLEGSAGL